MSFLEESSPASADLLSRLQDVCENATVALFVMDHRQHCIYMNRSAEELTGFTLQEVQGAALHEFVHHHHPDGRPYPLKDCPIDRAAPANMREKGEEVFVHKDGTFYPVTFTASPIRRGGQVIGTVIEVQDARPRLQQEAEHEAMREIGHLVLQELEVDKIVEMVTDTATRLSGAQFGAFFYNQYDAQGERYMLYRLAGVSADKFSQFPMPRATPLFGPTFAGERTLRIADVLADPRYGKMGPHHGMPPGHLPVRSYLAVPVRFGTGEVVGGLFFGHELPDVFTAHHERLLEGMAAQAAIGLNKARLFEEVNRARQRAEQEAEEKQRLYHEAAEANRLKDQFLATVSHELRTPLTSILGWAKLLATGRLAPELAERAVVTIDRNARAQAQIVEDLLDISRIVSGKLRLNVQQFTPVQAVEAAIEAMRPAAMAKDIRLQLLIDPAAGPITGDPQRLQQIIWNLVSNAVKFTPKGGRISVTLERINSHVEISVRDNGAGIAPQHLPQIFERFTQVDASSTRQHGGLGLGLAIVRELVELHGGNVWAGSDGIGLGSTFTVCLPLAPLKASAAPLLCEPRVHPASHHRGTGRRPAAVRTRRLHHPAGRRRRRRAPDAGHGAGKRWRHGRARGIGRAGSDPGGGVAAGHRGERHRHARSGWLCLHPGAARPGTRCRAAECAGHRADRLCAGRGPHARARVRLPDAPAETGGTGRAAGGGVEHEGLAPVAGLNHRVGGAAALQSRSPYPPIIASRLARAGERDHRTDAPGRRGSIRQLANPRLVPRRPRPRGPTGRLLVARLADGGAAAERLGDGARR